MHNDAQAYLLRLWPQRSKTETNWRFSLQAVPDGERIGFADLVELLIYLEALTPLRPMPAPKKRRLKMTPQQITLVKETFALVEPIADDAAQLFYGRLFTIAPPPPPPPAT